MNNTSNTSTVMLDREYISHRRNDSLPEWIKILAAQILVQAIKDAKRKNKQLITQADKEDACHWINSNEDKYIFDFINVCRFFNIDPAKTRIKINNGIKIPNLYPKKR